MKLLLLSGVLLPSRYVLRVGRRELNLRDRAGAVLVRFAKGFSNFSK
jgi:hypothetical protein